MKLTSITMDSVESSQIHSIGYDAPTRTLAVRFKARSGPGSLYHYGNVSEAEFAEFQAAESKGSFFGRRIKPFESLYPFKKIDESALAAEAGRCFINRSNLTG